MHKNTKFTKDNFEEIANIIHNNFYNYSLVNFVNLRTKIEIICPVHGLFTQTPQKHIRLNRGCRKCAECKASLNLRDSKEDFLKKAEILYGDKYDYSLVQFNNHHDHIDIICSKHGKFNQTINSHLAGKACRGCAKDKMKKDESFYNFTKDRWKKITKSGYLYLVEVYNSNERFYKVGITKSIKERFKYIKNYEYKIVNFLFLDKYTEILWEKEMEFHLENQSLKYVPKLKLNGSTECYQLSNKILENFKNKSNI